jgi:N,N'-diacetyllegionaminate synthase
MYKSPFIIAEVGLNHNGDLDLAKATIKAAHESGASAVKLQTFQPESLCSPNSQYFSLFKQCYLNKKQIESLIDYSYSSGITLFSSVFDKWSVDIWNKKNTKFYKIASCDINNIPLLEYVAKTSIPTIISTGASNIEEVDYAFKTLKRINNDIDISILHCVSNYPALPENINLKSINYMKNYFDCPIGFSDHTKDNIASIAAVAAGANIIEKHFTLDKNLDGPDHKHSSDPSGFNELVKNINLVYVAMGEDHKVPSELPQTIIQIRRSITAKNNINKDEKLNIDNIIISRPGNGIEPKDYKKVIGMRVKKDIKKGQTICWTDIS